MNIFLRARERIYINGAVIRVDRKTTIELLNEASFLLENHVMQAHEATTPLRRIYFAVQIMLMDPASAAETVKLAHRLIEDAHSVFATPAIQSGLQNVVSLINRSRNFEALKTLRSLFPVEQEEMAEADAIQSPVA
jgi:flagellar biosynthesis repressor protein FlbT